MSTEIRTVDLPPLLREIAGLTSTETALRFADYFGGRRLYVARRINEQSKLALVVGLDHALAISRRFGGTTPLIPRGIQAIKRAAHRGILADLASGTKKRTIAARHRVTIRWIEKLAARG